MISPRNLKSSHPLVLAGITLLLTTILMNFEWGWLESKLYDWRMSRGGAGPSSKDLVLIEIDETTLKALEDFSPLALDHHAQILEAIARSNPKAVGYLIDFNRVEELAPDSFTAKNAERVKTAIADLQSHGIPFLLGTSFDVTGEVLPPARLQALPHALALIHKDGNFFSEDKITRRALTTLYGRPAFHLRLAQEIANRDKHQSSHFKLSPRGEFSIPEMDAQYFFFRYRKPGTYAWYSASDLITGKLPSALLEGKIVLVGTKAKEDASDFAFTPFSKVPFTNSKIDVHASILDSILAHDGILLLPSWVNWLFTFAVIFFVLNWVLGSTPLYGVFATLALAVTVLFSSHFLFAVQGVWIRESQPLIGIFLAYYIAVPYRLIREYKKRWDYQRKNELMMQVEEMKTNFLSLVTHDLKTPVARIQGLAEVLLRQSKIPEAEKKNLESIIGSTDELNRFIGSILELTKVESNRVALQLQSKDVNILVEKAAESFKAQARASGILLETKLEPLFPIRIDSSLISKVLNNLIDNAIKYSPEGSVVKIESTEADGQIRISVSDQGIGMSAEELDSLFTRFYRAKNDTTTRVIGTGLGLYLTRYFVEAHQGKVSVESEKGKGSKFTIALPIESSGLKTELTQTQGSRFNLKEKSHV